MNSENNCKAGTYAEYRFIEPKNTIPPKPYPYTFHLLNIAVDDNSNVFAVGFFSGTLNFGSDTITSQGYDVVILKLDSNLR